jgi:hypothetical protein
MKGSARSMKPIVMAVCLEYIYRREMCPKSIASIVVGIKQ